MSSLSVTLHEKADPLQAWKAPVAAQQGSMLLELFPPKAPRWTQTVVTADRREERERQTNGGETLVSRVWLP